MDRRAFLKNTRAQVGKAIVSGVAIHSGMTSHVLGQESFQESLDSLVYSPVARGSRAAVATVHPMATGAAIRVLRGGGNAADAAIAAAVMLSVVDGFNSGLGGGCFVLAKESHGQLLAIDGREMAPSAAHPEMFLKDGVPQNAWSETGALASGVPGAVAAYDLLSSRLGSGHWRTAFEMGAEVAENGWTITPHYASRITSEAQDLARFTASRETFFSREGTPLKAGERLVQRDLAKTLREIAAGRSDAFYNGTFASQTEKWMEANGGLLTRADFVNYQPVVREPIVSRFRDFTILGFPPPSSGGIHVAQILRMLDRFDLRDLYLRDRVTYYHVVGEAMRLAFADRAKFLGDPDFTVVPKGLLDEAYLRSRSDLIQEGRRIDDVEAGLPPSNGGRFSSRPRHTTHLSVVDEAGMWVAITATINTTFGSKVVIPGTGVVMNNEMDDFAIAPGVPNAFGLVGNEANAPAPGKRPLSSMSPTIAVGPDGPVLTCGAAGGPRIISATAQILLNHLAVELSVPESMSASRVHHQWMPDKLLVEDAVDEGIVSGLEQRGHKVERVPAIATAQAIGREDRRTLVAAAESRLPGAAGAF